MVGSVKATTIHDFFPRVSTSSPTLYFIVRPFPPYLNITVNLCRESYISGRMLNTFSYGSGLSQLPKRDNLHIKDKRPAPNLSVIRKFCRNSCLQKSSDSILMQKLVHVQVYVRSSLCTIRLGIVSRLKVFLVA